MNPAADDAAVRAGAMQDQCTASRRRARRLERGGQALAFVAVLFFALLFVAPLIWMIITSFKSIQEVYSDPVVWWPAVLRWSNYPNALNYFPFLRYLWNTIQVTVPATIGVTLSSSVVAYGFSRLRWKGRDV